MPSDTASTNSRLTIPISPTFSTDTASSAPRSEATSDEQPDLGAFTTVLWAWNHLQPPPRIPASQFHSSPSSRTSRIDGSSVSSFTHPGLSEASGTEEGTPPPPETVWAQHQLQSYFNLNSITPSSERIEEIEDDQYEISVENDNPQGAFANSPPPPSPLSDGSRTVEILEAASDIEIPATPSGEEESLDQSPAGRGVPVPVTVFSPNRDSSVMLHGSDEGDNSSLTSREPPLRTGNDPGDYHHHPAYSFHRSSSNQIPSLRNRSTASSETHSVQITPRRSDFPIHDRSSVYSQSTSRTAGTRNQHSLWSSPSHTQEHKSLGLPQDDSPQNVPIDDSSSLYSTSYRSRDDPESAVRSLLTQARARALVNDNSTLAHSSVDGSDGHSTMTREYSPGYDPFVMQTPESITHSLASESQSTDFQSMPLLSRPPPDSSPLGYRPGLLSKTQREADSVLGRQLQAKSFSPQVEPPSPLPTPDRSEVFPYSPAQRSLVVDGGDDDDESRTPTHNLAVARGQKGPTLEAARYLGEGASHPYPHPLKGHHLLPTTMQAMQWQSRPSGQAADPTEAPVHHSDEDRLSGQSEGELDSEQPSLGLLDEALGFIAAERAKWEAGRDSGLHPPDATFTPPLEWQHVVEPKRKRRRKKTPVTAAKDEISPSPSLSGLSATRPLLLAADAENKHAHETSLSTIAPYTSTTKKTHDSDDSKLLETRQSNKSVEKRITILSRPKPANENGPVVDLTEEPLILTGKKGNRVGRKERERAKARRDRERTALLQEFEPRGPEDEIVGDGERDWDADDDDVDLDDDDEDWVEGDVGFSSSSAPEKPLTSHTSAGSRAYIHHPPGKGAYKSTPATPGTMTPSRIDLDVDLVEEIAMTQGKESEQERETITTPVKVGRARKKPRTKRSKSLVHSKSYPNLHSDATLDTKGNIIKPKQVLTNVSFDLEDDDISETISLDQNKRSRLIALAHKLQMHFPEQRKDLTKVLRRLENVGRKEPGITSGSDKQSIPGRRKRPGHVRNGSSKGGGGSFSMPSAPFLNHEDSSVEDRDQDPAELVIRGTTPGDGAPLIHIFIDHSNILIGLLNFLKRSPPPENVVSEYLTSQTSLSSPVRENAASTSKVINIPESSKESKKSTAIPIIESPSDSRNEYPIQLPSFATAKGNSKTKQEFSKSLPTESFLDAQMAKRAAQKNIQGVISDGNEGQGDGPSQRPNTFFDKKLKKFPRHLWHAAFVLVLERGRAVSRRVVVTSSPLYQPMEKIQNLGYEVRVYIRVPDLGNGMDRERHKDKEAKYAAIRPTYGGSAKGPSQVSSASVKKTHIRHLSGSTSAESGSAGSTRPGTQNTTSALTTPGSGAGGSGNSGTPPSKVRYREQGVDELLQLKLHQAIADADAVPKGSTIVLATGDGNVGQFNEDGFLGPVRTALKRGWRVELYAWEDGLSRSWRREFGENSEWGRKGLFRIIPLEQFATSLVEASGW